MDRRRDRPDLAADFGYALERLGGASRQKAFRTAVALNPKENRNLPAVEYRAIHGYLHYPASGNVALRPGWIKIGNFVRQ